MPESKPIVELTTRLMTSPATRRSFHADPIGVARFLGVERVSPKELDALATLSEDELETLAQVRAKMLAANPEASDVNGYVVF